MKKRTRASSTKIKQQAFTHPRAQLHELARKTGCYLFSIGDIERLAGVNTHSDAERRALWHQFRHLFGGPVQTLFDAVMDYCADIALRRIARGELCLVRTAAQ